MTDQTFDHAMITLLGCEVDSDAYLCLSSNGIHSAYDIAELNREVLDGMIFNVVDEAGKTIKKNATMNIVQKNKVLILGDFIRKLSRHNNNDVTDEIIMNTSRHEYDAFRVDSRNAIYAVTTAAPLPSSSPLAANNEMVNFLKGVKRDITQYPEIKDERQFENWQRSFLAVARSHRINQVFDPSFKPSSDEDKLLFEEKQKFAFTVLDAKLQTNMGKTILRSYASTGDAQKVWKEFVDDAKKSLKAMMSANTILEWITTAKFNPTNWRGSAHDFLLYWLKQVGDYDSFMPTADHLQEAVKLRMLINAVDGVPEFRSVYTMAETVNNSSGKRKDVTFQQYVDLLQSAIYSYDQKHSKQLVKPTKQHVFSVHEVVDHDEQEPYANYDTDDSDNGFDIDTYLTNIMKRKMPIQGKK
jgi:hypothetical protein